jgi:hypothetical protein
LGSLIVRHLQWRTRENIPVRVRLQIAPDLGTRSWASRFRVSVISQVWMVFQPLATGF